MRNVLLIVGLAFVSACALAQEGRSSTPRGRNEFGFWGGVSSNEPMVVAISRDRRVSLVGLRYGRRIFQTKPVAFTYTFDLLPLVLVSQPRNIKGSNIGGRELVYGAGLSPVGVRFDLMPRRALHPFVNASGGAVLFTRNTPYSDATKFNYMFEAGMGIALRRRSERVLTLGWKFHHISNAERVPDNPGIDSNIIYMGFSLFK
jgi:hypothetical protein